MSRFFKYQLELAVAEDVIIKPTIYNNFTFFMLQFLTVVSPSNDRYLCYPITDPFQERYRQLNGEGRRFVFSRRSER